MSVDWFFCIYMDCPSRDRVKDLQMERRRRRLAKMARELSRQSSKKTIEKTRRIQRLSNEARVNFATPYRDPLVAEIKVPPGLKPVKLRKSVDPEDINGKLLMVTSFNRRLYDKTGHHLLESFHQFYDSDSSVHLLVCYEDMKFKDSAGNIITYNLDESNYLRDWSRKNAHNIPSDLGGTGTGENNPRLFSSKFNLQMSRWFRKIASLEYALRKFSGKYRGICWVDCDCAFQKYLHPVKIFGTLQDCYVGYHYGLRRALCQTGVETGFLIFRGLKGYQVLQDWIELYNSGKYSTYSRWDDGYVFKELIDREYRKSEKKTYLLDLGRTSTVSSVMNESVFRDFILHNKGVHYKHIFMDDLSRIPGSQRLLT